MYEKKVTSVEDTRNAINIQSQINYAVQSVIKDLEIDGYVVPSVTVSVKGDTREVWSPEKHFIKIYYHYINFIESTYGLSITEKGIIYELTKYIDYESNLLINNKGLALNRKDLNSILKLGNNAIDINLALIVDKGVIAKIKVGRSIQYYMNPKVAYKGSKISNSLIELFGN